MVREICLMDLCTWKNVSRSTGRDREMKTLKSNDAFTEAVDAPLDRVYRKKSLNNEILICFQYRESPNHELTIRNYRFIENGELVNGEWRTANEKKLVVEQVGSAPCNQANLSVIK